MNAKRRKRDGLDDKDKINKLDINEGGDPDDIDREDSGLDEGARPADDGAADVAGGVDDTGAGDDPRVEIERLRSQYLRLNADFDNFRKRTQRDKQEWSRYASQDIVEKLLRVMDNFEAATGAVTSGTADAANVTEGFLMIYKQLIDILSQEGLTEIPALGEPFDPNKHEAVMTVSPGAGQKDNEIVMVMRKGYMLKDKVLRPSMVQVAKDM